MTRTVVWMVGNKWFESVSEAQQYKRDEGIKDEIKLMYLERLPSTPVAIPRKSTPSRTPKPPSDYDPTKPLPAILEKFV